MLDMRLVAKPRGELLERQVSQFGSAASHVGDWMTIFSVRHVTSYRYTRPVEFGEHRLMFRPRDSSIRRY